MSAISLRQLREHIAASRRDLDRLETVLEVAEAKGYHFRAWFGPDMHPFVHVHHSDEKDVDVLFERFGVNPAPDKYGVKSVKAGSRVTLVAHPLENACLS